MVDALKVSKHPALRVPPLRKAVRTLLSAGRTPEHAQARIDEGWWRAGVPERIRAGEVRGPVGYLATILSQQDCQRPDCERGIILRTGEECRACDLRAVERQAERARLRLERDHRALESAQTREPQPDESSRPGTAHPASSDLVTWRCEAPGSGRCGKPGRGKAPALRMCDDCLETVQQALTGR